MSSFPGAYSDPVRMILHPTDLSPASELAFAHALRLAVHHRAGLSILHINPDPRKETPWDEFPSVIATLERWGLLDPGARRSDAAEKLGVQVEKVEGGDADVVGSIVGYVVRRPVDMMVLSTEGREGLPQWFKPSIAEEVARRARLPTLFVPRGSRGCVSPEDGRVTLESVLAPVDHRPSPEAAVARAVRAVALQGGEDTTLTLLHVGDKDTFPEVRLPGEIGWRCSRVTRAGDPAEEILKTADETAANLIVMVTEGQQGFLDVLRGSTTEQVLRRSPCPVLAVPVES